MTFTAKIENGILYGYDAENDAPFLEQPAWPDGTPWANEAQALEFFDVLVVSFTDETAPLVGDNPSNHPKAREVVEAPTE
jgi:hypothetical protein